MNNINLNSKRGFYLLMVSINRINNISKSDIEIILAIRLNVLIIGVVLQNAENIR